MSLATVLRSAAVVQLAIAITNLFFVRIMRWQAEVGRMPLLVREVFRVHSFFITFTVAAFAVLTWRFAGEFAAGATPLHQWLSGAIALFWGTRAVMQWTAYSSSHWRGQVAPTAVHFALFFGYSAFAAGYAIAAIR